MNLDNGSVRLSNDLYHYCSIDTFINIIKSHSIRVSDIYSMNDDKETKIGEEMILNILTKSNDIKYNQLGQCFINQKRKDSTYVSSFSRSNNPICWKRYADSNRGVCIKFDQNKIKIGMDIYGKYDIRLAPVFYEEKQCRIFIKFLIKNLLDTNTSIIDNTYKLINSTCLFKTDKSSNRWQDEEETRLIYSPRNIKLAELKSFKKDGQVRYCYDIDFNYLGGGNSKIIDKIILGPEFPKDKINVVKDTLINNGFDNISIV